MRRSILLLLFLVFISAAITRGAELTVLSRSPARPLAVAEGLAQVVEQVVAVLDADRQPDQVAGHLEWRAGDGGVRHPRRVLDQ